MMKKKLISILMALCMVVTMLPATAFATEGSTPIGASGVIGSWDIGAGDDATTVKATLSADGTTLAITGTGAMKDWGQGGWVPWEEKKTNITKVDIESGVTAISKYAFRNCEVLTTVTFAEGSQLKTIDNSAFYGCTALTSITIPAGVTTIGNGAFNSCTKLESVTFKGTTAPTLGTNVFDNAPDNLKIYIPAGATGYTGGEWAALADKIVQGSGGTPPPTTGGDDNDNSSSSSSTVTPPASSSNVESKGDGKVIASKVAEETATAIAEAKKNGTGTRANIVAVNPVYVAPQTLQDMAVAAQKAGGTAWLFADSVVDGKVMVRIYMNTANAQSFKENILLGGTVSGKAVDYTKNKFVNFDNKMAIVSLAQQKPFAVSTEIAAKVDLTGLDTKTLHFYSYDRATNKYYPLSAPSYRMDKSGYLHFNTTRGGDIVITDKPLTLKK